MYNRHLHIVTHEVPWPVDHGGLFDLFYKLKALHEQGVLIHLHCFTKGAQHCEELNAYCYSVNYYPRLKNFSGFSLRIPLIVNSRKNNELLRNLQKDDHPVLLEGIHTTYWLWYGKLNNRKVFVRLHNIEFEYYNKLARVEKVLYKRAYYFYESTLLKKYEKTLATVSRFLAVNRNDAEMYKQLLGASDIRYLPVFLPYSKAGGLVGRGCYCLYHGNLAINENEKAATWLLKNVFSELKILIVIAGKDPSAKLEKLAHLYPHACLVANPSEKEMSDLIAKAHIHVLPSFNTTGIKLKLLNAFFNGRHCLANDEAVTGTGLEGYCHIANDAGGFRNQISSLYPIDFSPGEIKKRNEILLKEYNTEKNVKELIRMIWDKVI